MEITKLPRDDRESIINTEDFSRTKHPLRVEEIPRRIEDLRGRVFTRLTILRICSYGPTGATWWCRCECGTEKAIIASKMIAGKIKSCGCLTKENQAKFGDGPKQKVGDRKGILPTKVTIDGDTQYLGCWLRKFGIRRTTYNRRIARGWSVEDAIKIPPRRGITDACNELIEKKIDDRGNTNP